MLWFRRYLAHMHVAPVHAAVPRQGYHAHRGPQFCTGSGPFLAHGPFLTTHALWLISGIVYHRVKCVLLSRRSNTGQAARQEELYVVFTSSHETALRMDVSAQPNSSASVSAPGQSSSTATEQQASTAPGLPELAKLVVNAGAVDALAKQQALV